MVARSYSELEVNELIWNHSNVLDTEILKLREERNCLFAQVHGVYEKSNPKQAIMPGKRCFDCLEVLSVFRRKHHEICSICQARRKNRIRIDPRRNHGKLKVTASGTGV